MKTKIKDIWKAVCKGDKCAWQTLVLRFEALVNTVALRCGLSRTDAEDCAQHTWMSLYKNRHAIKNPDRLSAWLIQTTRRRAIWMKTKADLAVRSGGEPDEVSTLTPEDELIRLERQALLEVAVAQLDDRCRTLIESLFYSPKDKSYRQIANELGIPPNSLGPIRSRCLKRLKKILDEMG